MSKPFDSFEKLVALARRETTPETDVAHRVLARLRAESNVATIQDRPLVWLTLGSAVAAVAILLLSIPLYESVTDPLAKLFDPSRATFF